MNIMKLLKLYLIPIVARSAPNNGRVKEAKVSFCTQGTNKAVNGKVKRGDKTNVDRRANDEIRRDVDEVIKGKVGKGDNRDKNIGRREDKSKNVRGNGAK